MNKTVIMVTAGILFAMALTACSKTESKDPPAELVIGVSQDFRTTDVFSHKGFNCLVFQTLVKTGADGSIQPLLADSWEVNEDGTSYTFHLNKKAVFSDGTPVTARQVKTSFLYKQTKKRKRGPGRPAGAGSGGPPPAKPEGAGPPPGKGDEGLNKEYGVFDNQRYHLPQWFAFRSMDEIDDHTLRFTLSRPYTLFLSELATTHMYPVLKADDTEPVTGYIGTGPYRIEVFKRTQYMTLVRNEHFWQGKPAIDRIRLKVIPDAETRAIALEAGEIHMTGYDHFDKIPNESVLRLRALPNVTTHRMTSMDHPSISYIAINYKRPPFTDKDVRQAICLAIDRNPLDQVMSETGRTTHGPFPKDHPDCAPDIDPAPFDPGKARQLLATAGWADSDQDGILEKDGQRLAIALCFNSFDPQYKTVAEIVQAQLKAVGIELKLQMMELGAHITVMRDGTYDLALWPMMRYHMFFYTGHPSWLNVYNSPDLDEAFTAYLHDGDAPLRLQALARTQQLIVGSRAFPLFFERYDVVAWNHAYLKDFEPQPLGWDLSMGIWKANLKAGSKNPSKAR